MAPSTEIGVISDTHGRLRAEAILALEDATRDNGCLWVQPGGHRGPLRERFVREGDAVRQGDTLIQLETQELQAAVDQALAAEQQARARVAGLRSTGGDDGVAEVLARCPAVVVEVRAVGAFAPVVISAGTLGNGGDLILSQHHRVFLYQRQKLPGGGDGRAFGSGSCRRFGGWRGGYGLRKNRFYLVFQK